MTLNRTVRILILALVLVLATVTVAPAASAERVTGCVDGWEYGDRDCFVADHEPSPRCLNVRECGPPS